MKGKEGVWPWRDGLTLREGIFSFCIGDRPFTKNK